MYKERNLALEQWDTIKKSGHLSGHWNVKNSYPRALLGTGRKIYSKSIRKEAVAKENTHLRWIIRMKKGIKNGRK